MGDPLVSCVMVTRDRARLARRALDCLAAQTWRRLELVVVDDGLEDYTAVLDGYRGRFDVRYVRIAPDPARRLGGLRNLALDEARGDLVAQWDDDEWYHPERIASQVAALDDETHAVVLKWTLMHVDAAPLRERPYRGACWPATPGTVLHRRTTARYPNWPRAEDTEFLRRLGRHGKVRILDRASSHLFIRCFHGANTWTRGHFVQRLRRTPLDWLHWIRSAWIARDVTRHPAFALDARERDAADRFLADSRRLGLLAARPVAATQGEAR